MAKRIFDREFLQQLDQLSIVSRRVAMGQAKGERRSLKKGVGVEFQDYRPYVAGDDFRYVDWNIYCRLDRLTLKLFVEEEDLCLHLLVDGSASMGFGSPLKFDYALQVAAALGYIGLTNLERVGVGLFTDGTPQILRPRRGRGQIFPLLEFLGAAEAKGTLQLNAALTRYALRARTPGVAVVLTDLLDPGGYADGLKALLSRRFEVLLLHIVSEEELNPALRGDLTLLDAEDGLTHEVSVDRRVLEEYQARLQAHFNAAEAFCVRHRIDYLRASTTVPWTDLILRHLRRGGFLR